MPDVANAAPRTPDLDQLREMIVAFARRNGESHPTDLRIVETTSTAARALRGSTSNEPSFPIYVLIASGHFVSSGSRPPGARPPVGATLHVLVAREGLGTVGWGLSPGQPDFETLGTVRSL
jgi:hypothetical protein